MTTTNWPAWFKNAIATAALGVPVVLWLSIAHVRATDADTRSRANELAIHSLSESYARVDERLKAMQDSLDRIEKKLP